MAAPSVSAVATTSVTAASASWTVNLPTIVAGDAGKLLVMFIRAGTNATVSPPTGWNQIGSMNNEASQQEYIWWKRVAGNESSTVTVATWSGTAPKGAVAVALISGAADPNSKSPDNLSSTAFTTLANANPNPASVSMSPTCDALYIAWGSWVGNATVSSYPSGYTGAGYVNSGANNATDCSVAIPWKQVTASSADDPGTYTISASKTWTCRTMGVFPGNYLAVSKNIGLNTTVAAITTKLAAVSKNIGLTTVVNAQKQWFAQIAKNIGLTTTAAAVTTRFATVSKNIGLTIVASLGWGVRFLLGPTITVAPTRTTFATVAKVLGLNTTLTMLGGGIGRISMNIGMTISATAGRVAQAAASLSLGLLYHICGHVNPKFLTPLTEALLALSAESEDSLTLTAEAEDPFTTVVYAEVTLALTGETEDTLTLTSETEETTEC